MDRYVIDYSQGVPSEKENMEIGKRAHQSALARNLHTGPLTQRPACEEGL
jgi:hypothetical protein